MMQNMRPLIFLIALCSALAAAPPKTVVFDYGGVVAKVDRGPTLEFFSRTLGKSYRRVKKDFSGEKLYLSFNKPKSFWEGYAGHPLPQNWFQSLEAHKATMIRATPGMLELIHEIKAQGIQVALLSNTNKHRARFLESRGSYDPFDPILLSCYLGVRKPDPRIFQRLLQCIMHSPDECVFVDNQKNNVEASRKLGIDGIVFTSADALREELRKREIDL